MSWCERYAEIANAVRAWQQPGQNAGMRTVCNGTGCECLGKTDALLCEEIQGGSLDSVVSVAVNVVGTERVDRNEEDVRAGDLLVIGLASNASARGKQATEERQDPHRAESITALESGWVKRNFGEKG